VLTDWLIIRRVAAELDRTLRGARVRSVGRARDGRFGIATPAGALAIDAFSDTPLVSLERELRLEPEAGWMRAVADALEGLRFERIRARRGDRLIAFECSSRSRFGVASGYRLVAELVPRFGNIVLLKDDTIVSAAREFTRADNPRRATLIGQTYEPPPLPAPPAGEASALTAAFALLARGGGEEVRRAAAAALRAEVPLVPRLVADSLVAEAARVAGAAPEMLAERCRERAAALVSATEGEPGALGDVFAYRDGARLVQCHVVPLAQYAALTETRETAMLPLLAEGVGAAAAQRARSAFAARHEALRARIERRRAALALERASLERERDDAAGRDGLRRQGELLYAHHEVVPPRASSFVPPSDPGITIALDPELDAKANAAAIFKRYRKAVGKLRHAAERLEALARDESFLDDLAWETERALPETIEDVAESIDRLDRRQTGRRDASRRRPLDVPLAGGARVYVGRSPQGNADLTFRVARPDDLWFHARATPGAHVVLRLDERRNPSAGELERAAQLAAFHSKARSSDKVAVDYTERKHVRRRQNAPPGLVWYTKARTLVVSPRAEQPAGDGP
jgi:predicted ribosome quality control (RQC) complex YloA/Tae2 family protein